MDFATAAQVIATLFVALAVESKVGPTDTIEGALFNVRFSLRRPLQAAHGVLLGLSTLILVGDVGIVLLVDSDSVALPSLGSVSSLYKGPWAAFNLITIAYLCSWFCFLFLQRSFDTSTSSEETTSET
jgi:hypothetical protein